MARLIWTPRAARDLARLHAFLASNAPEAATRAIRTIRMGVRILGRHPEAGRMMEDTPEIREWFIPFGSGGYVVLYRLVDDRTVVLAVRHSKEAGY